MKVNGTLMNYYIHCPRQCYLFGNRINLEDNSETVNIGKILHEERADNENTEIALDNIKLDNSHLEKEMEKIYHKLKTKYEGHTLYNKLKQKLYSKGFTTDEINNFIEKAVH